MFFRFAYQQFLYFIVPIFVIIVLYKLWFYRASIYNFPLASELKKTKFAKSSFHKQILFTLRFILLATLMFLIVRPQWVDPSSTINVSGVDIMIALDVSGSMEIFDDLQDRRSRIEVAKAEAIRFIDKRINDPIGIVLFGGEVISRCPLTLDKYILKEIVSELKIGYISPNATMLGTGLAAAINRLKNSKAKSKIVILLTDGIPQGDKVVPNVAIEIAKKLGVKIYTVGIGSSNGYAYDILGRISKVNVPLDITLLTKIAKETGGMSFRVNSPMDMRKIYDTIDSLEKTEIETNIFHNYYEAIDIFLWVVLFLFLLELLLKLFLWRGVSC